MLRYGYWEVSGVSVVKAMRYIDRNDDLKGVTALRLWHLSRANEYESKYQFYCTDQPNAVNKRVFTYIPEKVSVIKITAPVSGTISVYSGNTTGSEGGSGQTPISTITVSAGEEITLTPPEEQMITIWFTPEELTAEVLTEEVQTAIGNEADRIWDAEARELTIDDENGGSTVLEYEYDEATQFITVREVSS